MPRAPLHSQSRQKSCVRCAEGKRRCNRQSPQCSRCLSLGVSCHYVSTRPLQRQTEIYASSNSSAANTISDCVNDILFTDLAGDFFNLDDIDIDSWLTMSTPSSPISPLGIKTYPEFVVLDKWATKCIMKCLKDLPRVFFQQRKTPFIHPRLYDSYLPNAIQDAFTVSASYCTKNPETEEMVFRILEMKAEALLNQDYQTQSIEALLAAVQALMLFHVMQLFDGDIRQRSIAEQNLEAVRLLTNQLNMRAMEELDSSSGSTWETWIFAESLRRTVIMSLFIDGLYYVLKSGVCPNVSMLSMLPFTAGEQSWNATSDASWRARTQQVVLYGDFSASWEKGLVPGKLDPFEKFLLAPCVGESYRDSLEIEDLD